MKFQFQAEAAECGLACLQMILSAQGRSGELSDLRRRFNISRRGANLRHLMQLASELRLATRALRLSLHELSQLQLPCILHWDLNHFVVLKKVGAKSIIILDPAVGERRLPLAEVSQHFTGVALELTPTAEFNALAPTPRINLRSLTGRISGLWRSLAQIFAVAVVLELLVIVTPLFQQMVVDDVLTSGDRELLTVLVLGFGLLLGVQTLIGLVRSWMVIVLGQTLSLQWKSNVYSHLVRLPVAFFERRHLGDISSRFGSVQDIQRTFTNAAVEALLDGLLAVGALVMMLVYAPMLASVTIGAVALYGILRWLAYSPFRNAAAERLVVAAKENTHFLETLRAVTPLKLFGREDDRRASWQNCDVRTARMEMGFGSASTFIFGLENLLVLWLGAKLILGGMTSGGASSGAGITVGMLFAYLSYKGQFAGRVSALINYAVDLKMLSLHAERLADICLEPPEKDEAPPNDLAHLAPSIELRDVGLQYGDGEPWVLRGVNFKIDAGEIVALIGASGTGKTTLLKIALGILKPTEGEVLYGGIPVRHLGLQNVRRHIGTVMQDDVLLTGSLADNIAFFDLAPDQARIEACAQMAQVHVDIARMPMGYHTLVGDLGSGMSGGQKQRLLLARALYKDPKVLALDEATSHLDIANERAVTSAIAHMQLTRLVIAHRPETIAGAHRVVQIVSTPQGGQVVELVRAVPAGNVATVPAV
jgi:ATP-binding cassette subfamily B protein RaxB